LYIASISAVQYGTESGEAQSPVGAALCYP